MGALKQVGLAGRLEMLQRRNLLEHRFRAVARSFTLSAALPLNDELRRLLQEELAVQHLVGTADEVERAALASAVVQAMRGAAAAFSAAVGGDRQIYRVHLAVYPRLPGA